MKYEERTEDARKKGRIHRGKLRKKSKGCKNWKEGEKGGHK